MRFQDYEKTEQRKAGTTRDGHTWYLRVYEVPEPQLAALLPVKGAVLPGETQATAVLGPYIRDIRFGRKLQAKDGSGSFQVVVLEGRLLAARE